MLVLVSLGATVVAIGTPAAPGANPGIMLGTNVGHAATPDMPASEDGVSDDDDEHEASTATKHEAKSPWVAIAMAPFLEAEYVFRLHPSAVAMGVKVGIVNYEGTTQIQRFVIAPKCSTS